MQISKNFSLTEAVSTSQAEWQSLNREWGIAHLDSLKKTAEELEKVRTFFGQPVIVSSWVRCRELNTAVGGVATSDHVKCEAVDFTIKGYEDPKGLLFVFYWCMNNLNYGEIVMERPEGKRPWIHLAQPKTTPKEVWVWNGKDYEAV